MIIFARVFLSALIFCSSFAMVADAMVADAKVADAMAADNFGTVVAGSLYRSGAPTGFPDMKVTVGDNGVKTVINLEDGWNDQFPIERERIWCERNRVTFLNPALSPFSKPKTAVIRQIVEMVMAAEKPVLVHCLYGKDRTGLVIAAFRMLKHGWSLEQAYDEMVGYGHNPSGWLGDWKSVLEEIAREPRG